MPTETLKRTGGRSAAVLVSVRAAVEQLVRERGQERVTIPMVAERAGVNPTTIYRRWGDFPALVNDLATYRLRADRPLPDTGELRGDLVAWAQEIITHYRQPENAAILRGGAASAGETETDCLRNRRAEATMFLERDAARQAAAQGIDVERIVDHVVAPIVYRAIFQPWTLDDDLAPRLVSELYRAD